jgi:bifunctional ADP-heptose synthase (sugar kinase/adenylyltransferase)
MNLERLDMILAQFSQKKILVAGDFFLDKHLIVDQALAETSPATGLEAHQVVEVRTRPAAAGSITGHLRGMGAEVLAVGVIGDDGDGFEMLRGLDATDVDVDNLVIRTDRFTPSYTRPMLRVRGGAVRELNRLDIRNRAPMPPEAEDQVIRSLRGLLPRVHGVIVADEVPEEDFGVITERVRDELAVLAQTYSEVPFVVDSRQRIGQFGNALIKPNALEAVRAVDVDAEWRGEGTPDWELDRELIEAAGERLYRRKGQPVFLTLGRNGMLAYHQEGPTLVPAAPTPSQVDVAGAGYAAIAGITSALCAGASIPEAAEVGCLAAVAAIRPGGTAATASRKQMIELKKEVRSG